MSGTDFSGGELALWLDVSAGVAGDMLLGALVDAGASLEVVQSAVDAVIPGTVRLRAHETVRAGMRALKVDVELLVEDQHHRLWTEIRERLRTAPLEQAVRAGAETCFERLAVAEARVHGTAVGDVHFHEVGAWDSIADVVGTCAALADLGVLRAGAGGPGSGQITVSRISLGSGSVRSAHGRVAVPVPAVLELCRGWDVLAGGEGELATPTGAALVTGLASAQSDMPAMTVHSVGIGAGTKEQPDRANVVRVVLGQAVPDRAGAQSANPRGAGGGNGSAERLQVLEANVDDLDPRVWPSVIDNLLDAGAADAWTSPITMKRGRPAQLLSVLAAESQVAPLLDLVFASTSTIGVRVRDVTRWALERGWVDVDVRGQRVAVKVAHAEGRVVNVAAEFRHVEAAAAALGVPVLEVLDAAEAVAAATGLSRGSGIPAVLRPAP
jgi:pyridinium-3,5-bisthiocarboxylic acid mononucleotide nickel chelatase